VSELGYPAVTVGDIVKRARVSKAAFYGHFADKEDCFLAAMREGGKLMADRVVSATRPLPAGVCDEEVLRVACRAFLAFLTAEPAFARVFYIDMQAVDPRAIERHVAAGHLFAGMNQAWHERARVHHPEWPLVPYEAYLALAGASAELVRSVIRTGNTDTLGDLEETLVSLHLAVLAGRRWPSAA
jgi:AcrR family transcriptional regulator